MSDSPSHFSFEFLRRLATDRIAGRVRSLGDYLADHPGHEDTVAQVFARAQAARENEPLELVEGKHIGPYRLLRELGRGGQAVVWLAEDARLGRSVALKILHRPPGSAGLSARFHREARATAALDHPGICVVYESGEEDSCAWIAMQFVEGQTLGEVLDGSEARDVLKFVALFEKLARALHAAHEGGVVHRDIKPANIIVRGDGEPVLLDFGVALLEEEGPQLTRTGTALGTPAYMSPEQLAEGAGPIGRATDVWSLGATLYEALTGSRPFRGATREALVTAVLHTDPIQPRRLAPGLSPDLAAVVETALCKEIGGRYQTALDLAEDLGRVHRGEPTAARPVGSFGRLRRWGARNPLIAALAATLLFSLVGGTVTTVLKNRELSTTNSNLRSKTEEAAASAEKAQAEARAKTSALAEYERMADARRLANAYAQADALYPLHPDLVGDLAAWKERYAPLFARLDSHRKALADMRDSAGGYTQAARERDHATALERIARLRRTLPVLRPDVRPALEAEAAALEEQTRLQVSWDFGEDVDTQFRHDALTRLVADLESALGEGGLVASVEGRMALAQRMQVDVVERYASEWESARRRIASNPDYDGLDLPVQVGLLPLGADPESGLEEFLVWETQPDGFPERGADGRFEVTTETGIVLVLVPPGPFLMGAQKTQPGSANYDPDSDFYEGPVHEVVLDAYFIGKYELTQAQWARATSHHPSAYYEGYNSHHLDEAIDLRHPVEQVSWFDCVETLRRLGLLVPTEAQWERAARGGDDTIYAGTSDSLDLTYLANIAGTEVDGVFPNFSSTHSDPFVLHAPVGSFEPNAFGLFDMTGNVWEWCRDRFAAYQLEAAPGDGERSSFLETRVYRGGSSGNREPDQRVAKRTETNADLRFNALGVRAARAVSKAGLRSSDR